VFHFLQEELRNYLGRGSLKKVILLELAKLKIKDRTTVLVSLVEACRHEFLDCLILQEVMFKY
jgi:hypothetical protein